jgi:hypothetical protein
MPTQVNAAAAPHSWSIETWPAHVYPGNTERARYFVRVHKHELLAAGALTRPGRELIIIGARFCRWLESKAPNAADFDTGAARSRGVRSEPPEAHQGDRTRSRTVA